MELRTPAPAASVRDLIRRFLPYLSRVRRPVIQVVVLAVLGPLIAAALLWLAKLVIDDVFIAGRIDLLPTIGAAYVVILAARIALDYVETRLEASVVEQIGHDVRVDLYRHATSVSPGSLGKLGVGDLLAHFEGDARYVEALIFSGLLAVFIDVISAVLFLGLLLVLSWKLTLCALLIVPFLVLTSWRLAPRLRRTSRLARRDETAWMSLAEERLGALPIMHAYGAHAFEANAFSSRSSRARNAELRTVSLSAWMSLLIEALAAIGGLVVLCVGAYEIHSGAMTVGAFIAFLGSVGSLYSPIRGLAKASGRFQRAAAGAQRVADVLDTPSLVTESPSARPLAAVQGALEFREVSFAYPGGTNVLDGVTLKIEPGEMVAVVGPSGGGKSTLVRLALRLHDPSAGAVLIDSTDLREVTFESLRRAVAVVFQEPHIFRGSIAENIRYGMPDQPREKLEAMARAAHADDFVGALPYGYASQTGPRGAWLSGGQRQRLALARALMREAPILLLDEATASVDGETEELIQDAVEGLAGRRTILIVGHRLSSIRRADRVVVIDHGRIVETGTPQSLLSGGSRYRELFAAQLAGSKAAA